jgi:hypothetical protein
MDAVHSVWHERQLELLHNIVEQGYGIIVYVDARYDTFRFAYYKTTSILHANIGYVLEMVTKTTKECGNAWRIEEIVIEEGLNNLLSIGVKIVEVVHDDKEAIDTILARMGIISQKDLWHKAKKLMAKLVKELCKKKIQ